MDKNEKDFSSTIFKICRVLERVSGSYFRQEINRETFMGIFKEELYKLMDAFRAYEKKKDN